MQKLTALILLLLLGLAGCYGGVEQISAERFCEESPKGYRVEHGIFTKDGFTPSLVTHMEYGARGSLTREEVLKTKGKPVVGQAIWLSIEKYTDFRRSKETVTLNEVPYVFVVCVR